MVVITEKLEKEIAYYMNDEIREQLAFEIAPCSPQKFIAEYCKRDETFIDFLSHEFGIDVDVEAGEVY